MGLPIREYRIAAVHQRFGGPWRVSESAGSNPATHTKQIKTTKICQRKEYNQYHLSGCGALLT